MHGPKSNDAPAKTFSKGKGDDRQKLKVLSKMNKDEQENEKEATWILCSQRLAEKTAKDAANSTNTNESVLAAAGLSDDDPSNGKRKQGVHEVPCETSKNQNDKDDTRQAWEHEPVVHPSKITAKEVKQK